MKFIDMGLFNNLSIRSKVISAFAGVLLCGKPWECGRLLKCVS
jgi:hypothetical protein